MSGQASLDATDSHPFRARRILRLRKEIALLEQMNALLWQKAIRCAGLVVGGLFLLFTVCAAKLSWLGFTITEALTLSAMLAASCWFALRYTKSVAIILGFVALSILTESFDIDGMDRKGLKSLVSPSREEVRRLRLERALARRRQRLADLENRT